MSQGSQITAGADAALRRNKRRDAAVEHLAKRVNSLGAHPGETFGKRIRAQQHHGANLSRGQRRPNTHGVRSHQVDLHFANLLTRNTDIAQLSHAGCDRVGNCVACDKRIHHCPGTVHRCACVRIEKHRPPLRSDFPHLVQSQIVAVNMKCLQEILAGFQLDYSHASVSIAARNAVTYLAGRGIFFISPSTTMWVVSPSATKVPSSARISSYSNWIRDSRMYFKCVRTMISSSYRAGAL